MEKLFRGLLERLKYPSIGQADIVSMAEEEAQRFNNDIVFDPEENLMAYTVRDPVGGFILAKEYKKVTYLLR